MTHKAVFQKLVVHLGITIITDKIHRLKEREEKHTGQFKSLCHLCHLFIESKEKKVIKLISYVYVYVLNMVTTEIDLQKQIMYCFLSKRNLYRAEKLGSCRPT